MPVFTASTMTLLEGWPHIIPMVVLIYALFAWHLRAEVAAMYSLGSLLLLTLIPRSTRRSLKNVPGILEAVTQGMMESRSFVLVLGWWVAPAMEQLGVPALLEHYPPSDNRVHGKAGVTRIGKVVISKQLPPAILISRGS